jgi:hypothetical protein
MQPSSIDQTKLFVASVTLLNQLEKVGLVAGQEVASRLESLLQALRFGNGEQLRDTYQALVQESASVQKYRIPHNFADLAQYIVMSGTTVTVGTFATIQAMGANAKEIAGELRADAINSEIRNPRRMSVPKINKPIEAIKAALALKDFVLKKSIVIPDHKMVEIEMLIPGGEIINFPPLPVPDWAKPSVKPRVFVPKYSVEGLNVALFSMLLDAATEYPQFYSELISFRNELSDIANRYYVGNGTPSGQVGRLESVIAVSKAVAAVRRGIGYEKYLTVCQRQYKFSRGPLSYKTFAEAGMNSNLGEVIKRSISNNDSVYKINLSASSGPWYPKGTKRSESYAADIVRTTEMLAYTDDPTLENFAKRYEFLHIVNVKNKKECYLQSDYTQKTRNFFVCDPSREMPVAMAFTLPMNSLINAQENRASMNLLKFKMFKGGFSSWVDYLISLKTPRAWNFSDNLYVYLPWAGWFSLDGAKQEGCATEECIQALMDHMMTWWAPVEPADKLGFQRFKRYNTLIVPKQAVRTIGQFGTYQLAIPGQPSGTNLTVHTNQILMGVIANDLMEIFSGTYNIQGQKRGLQTEASLKKKVKEDADTLFVPAGYTTLSNALDTFAMKRGIKLTMENYTPLSTITTRGLVPMDFLGNDGMWFRDFGLDTCLPVLNRVRLLKSLAFREIKDALDLASVVDEDGMSHPLNDGPMMPTIIEYFRLYNLYMIGGWAYQDIAAGLYLVIQRLWQVISEAFSDKLLLIVTLDKYRKILGEEVDENLIPELPEFKMRGPPTLFDIVELCCGEEDVEIAKEYIVENISEFSPEQLVRKVPWNLLIELGLTEQLGSVYPEAAQKQLASVLGNQVFTGAPDAPEIPGKVKRKVDEKKLRQKVKVQKPETTVGASHNPVKDLYQAKNAKGDWVQAPNSRDAIELLEQLAALGPIIGFMETPGDAKHPMGLLKSALATKLVSMLAQKSIIAPPGSKFTMYDSVRKSVETEFEKWGSLNQTNGAIRLIHSVAELPDVYLTVGKNKKGDKLTQFRELRETDPKSPILWTLGGR